MKLQAKVRENTGITRQAVGVVINGEVYAQNVPEIVRVEITEDEHAFYMFMYDEKDRGVADGWYESLEEAKKSAEYQFSITDSDWHESE